MIVFNAELKPRMRLHETLSSAIVSVYSHEIAFRSSFAGRLIVFYGAVRPPRVQAYDVLIGQRRCGS
jgi:hypothetical protein